MELESLIRRYVKLGKRSPKGFEPCNCSICNDYKPRGGFKFDGEVIGFHCFNCAYDTKFDPTTYRTPSDKFKSLLKGFGITDDELTLIIGKAFVERQGQPLVSGETARPQWSPPRAIEPPKHLHPIIGDGSPWCEIARLYLSEERGLDPACYSFFVSDEPKLLGRLIIPFFHRDRLTYYQARSMDDVTIQPRYANPPATDKEKLIFNYDELLDGTGPLYVTEGAFDALSIGPACALSGSTLGEWKLQELKKAAARGRRIVFVIDKNKNGFDLGLEVLKEGWHVAVMPNGVDDANQCLKKFGRLWLLNHLATTQVSDVAGQVLLRMKCAQQHTHSKKLHER